MAQSSRLTPSEIESLRQDLHRSAALTDEILAEKRADRAGTSLMTAAQHRQQAQMLRDAGNPELAQQHEMLAAAIEKRDAMMKTSSRLTPSEIESLRQDLHRAYDAAGPALRKALKARGIPLATPDPADQPDHGSPAGKDPLGGKGPLPDPDPLAGKDPLATANSSLSQPKIRPRTSMMTPEQLREQAELLRRAGTARGAELATLGDQLAAAIEKRDAAPAKADE